MVFIKKDFSAYNNFLSLSGKGLMFQFFYKSKPPNLWVFTISKRPYQHSSDCIFHTSTYQPSIPTVWLLGTKISTKHLLQDASAKTWRYTKTLIKQSQQLDSDHLYLHFSDRYLLTKTKLKTETF